MHDWQSHSMSSRQLDLAVVLKWSGLFCRIRWKPEELLWIVVPQQLPQLGDFERKDYDGDTQGAILRISHQPPFA